MSDADMRERFASIADGDLPTTHLKFGEILKAATDAVGISAADIKGRSRDALTVAVRAEAMLIAHEAGYSTTHIGRVFGGRDHTTVIYLIRKAKARHARGAFAAIPHPPEADTPRDRGKMVKPKPGDRCGGYATEGD